VVATTPYDIPSARTTDGLPVHFTRSPGGLNVIVVGRPTGDTVTIEGAQLPAGTGTLLSDNSAVTVTPTTLTFAKKLDGTFSPAVRIRTS